MRLSPAEYVIHVFGGVRATARVIGCYPATVSKWHSKKTKRGQKGLIPVENQPILLAAARDMGLDLTAEDLIEGREVHFTELRGR